MTNNIESRNNSPSKKPLGRMKSHKISRAVSRRPRREGTRRTNRSQSMFGDDDDSDMAENDVFFDYDPNQLRLDLLERGVLTTRNKLSDE